MRAAIAGLALLGLGLGAGACTKEVSDMRPVVVGGTHRYAESRVTANIDCDGLPVVLAGNRNVLELSGDCRHVTVAGDRNDVVVNVPPGGTIEITGAHNDVTWRQTRDGRPPTLRIVGESNAFHRG